MSVYLGKDKVEMKGGFLGNNTVELQAKTVNPTESTQTITPDSGYDGMSKVTVNPISSTYVGSKVTKKAATTYTPGTNAITISSGQYLSGDQKIEGSSNLLPANIKKGVSIFGKTGTYEGLDTSDADAVENNIEYGKTAYVNGEKITGNLLTYSKRTLNANNISCDLSQNALLSSCGVTKFIVTEVTMRTPMSAFGDATASDVISGKTFTSKSGLKLTGTYTPSFGIDTSDATATASDIAKDKTAYVNGEKITGTVSVTTGKVAYSTKEITGYSSSIIAASYPITAMFKGGQVGLSIPLSQFGNATAADVAAGKTFTSSAGLKVTGTASTSSGNTNGYNCEAYFISDVKDLSVQMINNKNVKAYGYAANGYNKYMFCGDKYTNVSYGISSAYTDLSLSIENGRVVGLPDISAGSLLITATNNNGNTPP